MAENRSTKTKSGNSPEFKGFESVTKTSSRASEIRRLQIEFEAKRKLALIEERRDELERRKLQREEDMVRQEQRIKETELYFDTEEELMNPDNMNLLEEATGLSNQENREDIVKEWIDVNFSRPEMEPKRNTPDIIDDGKEDIKQQENQDTTFGKFEKIITKQYLPKELPFFHGDPREWINFKVQFMETTEICGLSDRENLIRLQKCLKGKARESVKVLMNFPKEVSKIMVILERRFGRPEIIIDEAVKILKYHKIITENQLHELLDFSNVVQNLTVTVKNIGHEGYLMNPQLLRECVNKLPTSLKLKWAEHIRYLKKDLYKLSLEDFADWLENTTETITFITPLSIETEERRKTSTNYQYW